MGFRNWFKKGPLSLKSHHHHHHHRHWLGSPTWALAFLRSFCQLSSGYCFFRFRGKSLFQGGVVSPTPFKTMGYINSTFAQVMSWN
jgi:hypothetical protein